jgi:hypothetical protein
MPVKPKRKTKRSPPRKTATRLLQDVPPVHKNSIVEFPEGLDPLLVTQEDLPTRGNEGRAADNARTLEDLCRRLTRTAVRALEMVIRDPKTRGNTRVSACIAILDRGWGRPKERVEHSHKSDVSEMSVAELEAIIARETQKEEREIPPEVEAILPK